MISVPKGLSVRLLLSFTFASFFLHNAGTASAQNGELPSEPQVDTGAHSYGTYEGVHDNVSLSSGNLSFCIPLVSLPGVNKHDPNIPLCYNSGFLELSPQGNIVATTSWFPWVWGPNTPAMGSGWTLTGRPGVYGGGTTSATGLPLAFMPDGSRYSFPAACATGSACGFGPDGQMAGVYENNPKLYLKDGTTIVGQIGNSTNQEVDTNGNSISFSPSSVIDTLGRTVSVTAGDASQGSPAYISFSYPDPSGVQANVTVTVQMTTIQFSCNASQEEFGATGTSSMPSAVILPNGLSYTFQYNNCGLLTKVTYPSGGYTRYDYSLFWFNQYIWGGSGQIMSGVPVNELAHKYVCPAAVGSNSCSVAEQVTTYSPVASGTFNNSQNTVVDPVGNTTVYQFSQSNPNPFTGIQGVETGRLLYDASGKFWKSVQTQYATTTMSSCAGGVAPSLPTIQTTTLDNGMTSQIQWDYDCQYPGAEDSVLTEKREYDFGSGAPGPLLRKTDYTWLQRDNPSVYGWPPQGANILDRKTSEIVKDGNNNLIAQTKYVYDYGAGTGQGNRTAVSRWTTGNAWVTTSYVYDGHGNVVSKQDPNGNTTTYSYADNFTDGIVRNTNAYLTQTTYPNGATTQSQYYWAGGLEAASCGENFSGTCQPGLTSAADYASYTYDQMARKISVKGGDGSQSSTCYSDDPGASCAAAGYPLKVTTTQTIAAGVSKVSTAVLDGEGRTVQTQLSTDPSCSGGTVNVDETYDPDGREWTASNPYCSNAPSASTSGTTTFTYDGLGRKIQITYPDGTDATNTYTGRAILSADEGNGNGANRIQRISQKDALGRLIYACEITGTTESGPSSTPSACGLDIAATGFLTQYGYDLLGNLTSVQQGGVGRSFIYNPLSELTSATNPESGTTTYGYDNNGNMTSKTSQAGVTTTYGYDTLNRLVSKTYSDNSTPSACYKYDQGGTRVVGRLAAEWTQMGTCPATVPSSGVLTERTFAGYDLMGRLVTDQQCSALGNCTGSTPYSVSYGYDLAGDLTSFSNGLTGSSAMSFASVYDAAGQLSTLAGPPTAGSGGQGFNLFMQADYTPAGALMDAEMGPGISLHRDYNSRLLPTDEMDTVKNTPGSATVQITGTEQVIANSSGSITFSGAETYTGGVERKGVTYNNGQFLVNINGGQPYQIAWGQGDTPSTLATKLANDISCGYSPVQAVAVGATVYLTSCAAAVNTNYSLSAQLDGFNSQYFAQPAFQVATSGPTMAQATTYSSPNEPMSMIEFFGTEQNNDSGTFTVLFQDANTGAFVNIVTVPWNYESNPQSLAGQLASALPSCSSGGAISAVNTNSVVTFTGCQPGTAYVEEIEIGHGGPVPASFSAQADAFLVTQAVSYDSGTATLAINGTTVASTSYGPNSNQASIVSGLVSSSANNQLVTLTPSEGSPNYLTITAIGGGTDSGYTYALNFASTASGFSQPSFGTPSASGSLQGGQNAPLYNWTINTYAPNANVVSVTDSVMGSWQYGYDDMNRLATGNASAGPMAGLNMTWTYDRYGNRWTQGATGAGSSGVGKPSYTFTGNNNRIDGWQYDGDGNILNDGQLAYTYDAENRIATINGHQAYLYDAEGRRVAKVGSNGFISATYILGLKGEQVTELNMSGVWAHSNVYASGGRLLATWEGPGGSTTAGYHYHLTDWLGTERVQTNASGNAEETCTSYSFGDGLACSGTSQDATEQHFTGKEHDTESGLDYFGARYFASTQGRFMTPDWAASPIAVPYASFGDPQSLNLYAYVGNNPNTKIDADGHVVTMQGNGQLGDDELQTNSAGIAEDDGGFSGNQAQSGAPSTDSSSRTGSDGDSGPQPPLPRPFNPPTLNPDPMNFKPHGFFGGDGPGDKSTNKNGDQTQKSKDATTAAPSTSNGWDWDERPHYPKPTPHEQPFGQCFKNGFNQSQTLPVKVQVGLNLASIFGIFRPNPVSSAVGAINALYTFGTRVLPYALVCQGGGHFD